MSNRTREIKIEKGIPVPSPRLHTIYPWHEMKVGDNFLVPGTSSTQFSQVHHARRTTGFSFTVRKVEGGIRVWRAA